jgi:hypothetical protein
LVDRATKLGRIFEQIFGDFVNFGIVGKGYNFPKRRFEVERNPEEKVSLILS